MGELTNGVNWLAVGISTLLSFGLGALWYSPVMFGVKWAEGVGVEMGEGATQPVGALILQLIGTFLFAWIVGIVFASGSISLAVLIALSTGILLSASGLFDGNGQYAAVAEGAFTLAMFVIMLLCNVVL